MLCDVAPVADPGPLMLGVLDTDSQRLTDTNSTNQFPYRTVSHRSKRLNKLIYHSPEHLAFWIQRFFFHFILFKKSKWPRLLINLDPRCLVGLTYTKLYYILKVLAVDRRFVPIMIMGAIEGLVNLQKLFLKLLLIKKPIMRETECLKPHQKIQK